MSRIALCQLTATEQRLLEIVIGSSRNSSKPNHRVIDPATENFADIAIVDLGSAASIEKSKWFQRHNPAIKFVYLSEDGRAGESEYRIPKKYYLVQIMRMLDSMVTTAAQNIPAESASITPIALQARMANRDWHHNQSALERTRSEHTQVAMSGTTESPRPSRLEALVVDDSATARAQACAALERLNYRCIEAESAEEAMKQLGARRFNLMLLDVTMPGMNGFDLCSQLKHRSELQHMPIVMLTSRSMPFDRAKGVFSRCDAYLTKPLDFGKFQTTIQAVMKTYAAKQNRSLSMLSAAMVVPRSLI